MISSKRFSVYDYIFLIFVVLSMIIMNKNVLLFHALMEFFTIAIGFSLAIMAINNYKRSQYPSVVFIGIAFLFVGILDIFHVFAFPDMPLFKNSSIQLASQFWIAARLLESISIFIAVKFDIKQSDIKKLSLAVGLLTILSIYTILSTNYFPSTFKTETGLTEFKIGFEFIIVVILLMSLYFIVKNKDYFKGYVFDYLILAIIFSIATELSLTVYTDIVGVSVAIGHGLKIISFYMIYKGLVVVTINEPYQKMDMERIRFYTMFNKSNESILILKEYDEKLIAVTANEKACNMLGGELHQIVNKSFADLVIEINHESNVIDNILKYDNTSIFDVHLRSAFGVDIYADISSTKINVFDDEIKLMNIKDISLKKTYERDLFIYKSIIENSLEAIMVTDSENKIQWVNKGFESLYGYSGQELLGKNPSVLKSGEHDSAFYKVLWNSLQTKNYWIGELHNKKKDGTVVSIHESITNIQLPFEDEKYYFSIMVDLTEKEENEAKMFRLAYIDQLTGLYNLHYIEEIISNLTPAMLLLVELRNLSKIRLSVDKHISDQIVIDLVSTINQMYKDVDIYKFDYNKIAIAYNQNDEFVLNETIFKLKEFSSNGLSTARMDLRISGVKNSKDDCFILDMIAKAQLALDYFERAHNDIYVEYDPEIELMILEDENIFNDLKKAINNQEIEVYYQPFVDHTTGKIVGAEALARWNHPVYGFIPPKRFIKIAEDSGVIIQLGYLILFNACKQFKAWMEMYDGISLNVNVSVLQLQDSEFINHVEEVLIANQFPSDKLILEITESSALENFDTVYYVMSKLNELKVEFALDDFGTGFSSLSMLKKLPISFIKVDRSFVIDINRNLQNSLLVSAIISMAHHLGLTVIVEGVETYHQALVIKNNHCKVIQGYYYSEPVEAKKFEALLEQGFDPLNDESLSKEEEQEIETEKKYFQTMHNSEAFGVLLLDLNGKIMEANQESEVILGYLSRELEGKNFFEMMLDNSDQARKECINKIISNDGICDIHQRVYTKNGSVVELSINSYVDFDWDNNPIGVNCLIQDVTNDISKQMKLLRVREAYRKVFDESPIAIILWSPDYTITGWNSNAEDTFGWKKSEIIGSKISLLITDEEFMEWKTKSEKLLSGIPYNKFMANSSKSGDIVICEWFNKPIYNDIGEVDFVLSIVKDVTDIRKQEQEVGKMREIIVSQERMAEIGQLVAGIAHEINNPLSYMISNSEMLDEDIDMYSSYLDKIKEYLDKKKVMEENEKLELYRDVEYWEGDLREISESFKDGLNRIKEIVKGLKSFSWSGQKTEYEKYNINENISQVLIIARNELKYSTNVILDLDDTIPVVEAISNQINQVVLNMLINSKHAIESKFNKELGEINIKTWYDENFVYISVSDNGAGIEQEIIDVIFEPFFTTKPKNVGTGLGLSISKSIIEGTHRGKLSVESELGVGTKFIIQLPIKQERLGS